MPQSDPLSFAFIYADELSKLGRASVLVTQDEPYAAVDTLDAPLAALCLSGGGIRSASFALGIVQGLARFDLLGHFDYLSTVSGGGYIGGFLTAWRYHANTDRNQTGGHNQTKSDKQVFEALNRPVHPNGKEARQLRGIRAYSNYLTPKRGLLSADTWTGIAIVIRNLLLNWLVFLPFFMGVLLLPQICRHVIASLQCAKGASADALFYAAIVWATFGFAMASYGRRRSDGTWLTNGRFLMLVLAPLVIASMCLTAYTATTRWRSALTGWVVAVAWGAACYFVSSLLASAVLWAQGRGVGQKPMKDREIAYDLLVWGLAGALVGRLVALGMTYEPMLLLGQQYADSESLQSLLVVAGISWAMLCVLIGELLFVGLRSYSPRGDMDREWLARSAGWLAAASVGWSVFAAIALYGPLIVLDAQLWLLKWTTIGTAGVSGLVSLALGNSAKTAANASQLAAKRLSWSSIAGIAAIIFAAALAILLSWLATIVTTEARSWPFERAAPWEVDCGSAVLLVVASVAFSYWINVNRFSLHGLYRNRLVRAFLGSARLASDPADETAPRPGTDPFTGFADDDNLRLTKMPTNKLLHVINVTLDVVATDNLAWQQRKAESFTMTPLTCGNPNVGFRKTEEFGSPNHGITLGSAMALSGAAVSPNMGSHSSPLLGFLMTVFNLRLGWWLGNPRHADCAKQEGPKIGLFPLLAELAGQTTDTGSWVYLSDGGHFDNLGLYEMVRRRCRVIVVSDAGCDPDCALSDLGDCLRKIYIDLGVSINFLNFDIKKRMVPPEAGNYAAVADITYPGSPTPGWLVYIKPGYHGAERADVRSYAEAHVTFPHESTSEQWFNESQLESYRALGAHIAELLCNQGKAMGPAEKAAELDLTAFMRSAEAATGVQRAP